ALVIDISRGDEAAGMLSRAMFDANDNALLIKVSGESQGGLGGGAATGAMGSVVVAGSAGTSTTADIRYSHCISVKDGTETVEVVNKVVSELAKSMPVLTLLVNDMPGAREVVAHS